MRHIKLTETAFATISQDLCIVINIALCSNFLAQLRRFYVA